MQFFFDNSSPELKSHNVSMKICLFTGKGSSLDSFFFWKMPKNKSPCKYGSLCYRKNKQHLDEYYHPGDKDDKDVNG